jgi:hypothetical protein
MDRLAVVSGWRAAQTESAQQELEIAVPFTTPLLTRVALQYAESLGAGLSAHVRLLKVQVVPFPLELDHPPVSRAFLSDQLASMNCELPMKMEIYLARDLAPALIAALKPNCVTVLASKWRPWRTREEKLAGQLSRAGHQVLIRYMERKNA